MSEPSRDPMRRVLRAITHGVYVMGVRHEERDDYLVIALVMQCSVEPPRMAFALNKNARVLPALRAQQGGTLAVLDANQLPVVRRYGTPGGVRQLPEQVHRVSEARHPVIPEASAWLEFRVVQETAVGDHFLIVADVLMADSSLMDRENQALFNPMSLGASGFPYGG